MQQCDGMPRRVIGGRTVGELEAEVLRQLWAVDAPLTGRQLLERMPPTSRRAYTTLMTVVSRLVEKGLVARISDGRIHRYRAAGDPDQLTARAIGQLLAMAKDRGAVLTHLVEEIDDPTLLDELASVLGRGRGS
jgi:predicted transcriptional regulator